MELQSRVHSVLLNSYFLRVNWSQDSAAAVATRLQGGWSGVSFRQGCDTFSETSRQALSPTQPALQWVLVFSRGSKKSGP
jgi:hypothetical protein